MRAFGGSVPHDGDRFVVSLGAYEAREFFVEPDASAAAYFLAAAAITGGRITIEGLGTASVQGDLRFAQVLERMAAASR